MKFIILCGKTSDTSLSKALIPVLERNGGGVYCSARNLVRFGAGAPEFFVFDCEKLPQMELKNGILLFKNSFEQQEPVCVPPGFSCILESKNQHAASALQGSDAAAITCGTGAKDTLSIAALDENTAALSLQRSIFTVDGAILEPHDFTVALSADLGPYRILAVCAVLLISGINSADGYNI